MCPGDLEMRSDSGSLPENPGGMACMNLMYIASSMYPDITAQTLSYMVQFKMTVLFYIAGLC